jgi:hypothetical protein
MSLVAPVGRSAYRSNQAHTPVGKRILDAKG